MIKDMMILTTVEMYVRSSSGRRRNRINIIMSSSRSSNINIKSIILLMLLSQRLSHTFDMTGRKCPEMKFFCVRLRKNTPVPDFALKARNDDMDRLMGCLKIRCVGKIQLLDIYYDSSYKLVSVISVCD